MKISRRIAPRLFGILIATTLLVGACAPAPVAPTVAPEEGAPWLSVAM